MSKSQKILKDVVVYTKYARYIPELKRRETWDETVSRYLNMMKSQYPNLKDEIEEKGKLIRSVKVLPSMRALQFSGEAIAKNNARIYNCAYLPMDNYVAFSELMFLLLGGSGCGYSVMKAHIDQLPAVTHPKKERKFLVNDSIEGWADAIKALMKAYLGISSYMPRFDYSDIRKKGARLVTAGGKAPGPEPLKLCVAKISALLNEIPEGQKMRDIDVHDINCHIADAVLAGGIRRAALISLFDKDSADMLGCKAGAWWEKNPQRGRSNNSAVLDRNGVQKEEFMALWKAIQDSGSGEPGLIWSEDPIGYGTNPCGEIALRSNTFCNLTEINAGDLVDQADFVARAEAAAFFGTLQAGFTDFHYLRPVWKKRTMEDALIGVGITGIGNGVITDDSRFDIAEAAEAVRTENKRVAKLIGINSAARTTTIKPSGTTSCVTGTSSGIHSWFSKYYIRNMQCGVGDDLYKFFVTHHPEIIKIMDLDPKSAVIGIPQRAPDSAILRENESALEFLERIKDFNVNWVHKGHNSGTNKNNVSATVYIKPEEWESVGEWMWENRNNYNGLSVLPYDGGTYKDAPFTVCDEITYDLKFKQLHDIDLTKIIEEEDNTSLTGEVACAGGSCEVNF